VSKRAIALAKQVTIGKDSFWPMYPEHRIAAEETLPAVSGLLG
jgi:hypothetical protein